jgi:hypothetical protein
MDDPTDTYFAVAIIVMITLGSIYIIIEIIRKMYRTPAYLEDAYIEV